MMRMLSVVLIVIAVMMLGSGSLDRDSSPLSRSALAIGLGLVSLILGGIHWDLDRRLRRIEQRTGSDKPPSAEPGGST